MDLLNPSPEIWYILPRSMRYDQSIPTSIDLFVSEIVARSRFPSTVLAEPTANPLPSPRLLPLPAAGFAATLRRARAVAGHALSEGGGLPRVLIVQQHVPSAAAIARRAPLPVVLQKHNFIRPPRSGLSGRLGRAVHLRQFARLAGITFVSEAVRHDFERDWPEVQVPRCVVPNGFDAASWRPRDERERRVLVVGRATPEKGLREAAAGLALALADRTDWRADIVMSECAANPAYACEVAACLAPLGDRGRIFESLPPADVQVLNESAAIAMVPSTWREPFGRTCLEAHAGGAAVISSGTGGLREVSGEHALFLPAVDATAISASIRRLVEDESLRTDLAREGSARARRLFDLPVVTAVHDDFLALVTRGAATPAEWRS